MSEEKKKTAESPATGNVEIHSGSTIWDWALSSHDFFRKAGYVIGGVLLLVVAYFVSWIIPVFFVFAFGIGFLVFKDAFFAEDSVRVITTYDSDSSVVDVLLVGKKKFREMEKSGYQFSLTTTSGDPVFIAENTTKKSIRFSWLHESSRFEYMMKRDAFDKMKDLSEKTASRLYSIEHIPRVLALDEAAKYIQHHEDYYSRILNGEESDMIVSDLKEELPDEPESSEGIKVV